MQYIHAAGRSVFLWYPKKNETQPDNRFCGLSTDITLNILSFCDHETVVKVARCSRYLRDVAYENSLWMPYVHKHHITSIDEKGDIRSQIQVRYIDLRQFLVATNSYEYSKYSAMCETLESIFKPAKNDRKDHESRSLEKFQTLSKLIVNSDSSDRFIDKIKVLITVPSQHPRLIESLGHLFDVFRNKFNVNKTTHGPIQIAKLINVLLCSNIDFDYGLIFKFFYASFLEHLIQTLGWMPTQRMYDALLREYRQEDVSKELLLFKKHGFMPSFEHLNNAVSNHSLPKFLFLLSLNNELSTNRKLLDVAVWNSNLPIVEHLLKSISPDLNLLKLSLKTCLINHTSSSIHILKMILLKDLDPYECASFLNPSLKHHFGKGVLNDFVQRCDFERFKELLKDVEPELLTLQIALYKFVVDQQAQAIEIIALLIPRAQRGTMQGRDCAVQWLS